MEVQDVSPSLARMKAAEGMNAADLEPPPRLEQDTDQAVAGRLRGRAEVDKPCRR